VATAEKELSRATASLAVSDSSVAGARKSVAALDELASATADAVRQAGVTRAPPHSRLADPMECDSSSLPALMQASVDTIVTTLRAADALRIRREAVAAAAAAEQARTLAEAQRAAEVSQQLAAMRAQEAAARAEWQQESDRLAQALATADAANAEAALAAERTRKAEEAQAALSAAANGQTGDANANAADEADRPEPMFPPLIPPASPGHLVPAEMA
jgi:hypothetical protein